jgi:hypothetical protein
VQGLLDVDLFLAVLADVAIEDVLGLGGIWWVVGGR